MAICFTYPINHQLDVVKEIDTQPLQLYIYISFIRT